MTATVIYQLDEPSTRASQIVTLANNRKALCANELLEQAICPCVEKLTAEGTFGYKFRYNMDFVAALTILQPIEAHLAPLISTAGMSSSSFTSTEGVRLVDSDNESNDPSTEHQTTSDHESNAEGKLSWKYLLTSYQYVRFSNFQIPTN